MAKKKKERKVKKRYESKPGFVMVPLLRGVREVRQLLDVCTLFGANICGGYARYCASPRRDPVKSTDVDVYCKDDDVFTKMLAVLKEMGLKVRKENDMAVQFKVPRKGPFSYHPAVQLIKPIREGRIVANGDLKTILENFDFTVVRIALISSSEAMADADFEHDEKSTLIRMKNIHCPISSTLRCIKYSRKGYWLSPLECLKLFLDWSRRDEEYRQKLAAFLEKASEREGLSRQEVDQLEALMRID